MSIIDIIIIIPFVWAVIRGFREGVARQLSGIAGLILGVWLGFKFGSMVGTWLTMRGETAKIVGFIVVVIGVMGLCAFVGWLLGKLFKVAGLGMFDTIGGVLVSTLKMLIIMSVLVVCFDVANNQWRMVKQSRISNSKLYGPVMHMSTYMFPVINSAREKLFGEEQ